MRKSLWHSPGYTLLVVLFVIPLTGAGVDIYVPSLPAITQYFAAPAAATKLTIAAYLYGYPLPSFETKHPRKKFYLQNFCPLEVFLVMFYSVKAVR